MTTQTKAGAIAGAKYQRSRGVFRSVRVSKED